MTVHQIDPIADPRWANFVQRHPESCAFHSRGWLEALRRTYGYQPVALTTEAPGRELENAIVFCRIKSRLTGRRLVSLPFSDHCQPLVSGETHLKELMEGAGEVLRRERLGYVELRPLRPLEATPGDRAGFCPSESFYLHRIDIRAEPETLLAGFHASMVRRRIRRAQKGGVAIETGSSKELLRAFYHLLLMTRRRHRLPPQPIAWFRNLLDSMGDRARLRVASLEGRPIAAILTLLFNETMIYKYGCSDREFARYGATPALLWHAIEEGKRLGATTFDLGRSEPSNSGLVGFKDHWGGSRTEIEYYRSPGGQSRPVSADRWTMRLARGLIGRMPDSLLIVAGEALYRHQG